MMTLFNGLYEIQLYNKFKKLECNNVSFFSILEEVDRIRTTYTLLDKLIYGIQIDKLLIKIKEDLRAKKCNVYSIKDTIASFRDLGILVAHHKFQFQIVANVLKKSLYFICVIILN